MPQTKESYVDVLLRIRVESPKRFTQGDVEDVVNDLDYKVESKHPKVRVVEVDIKEVEFAGKADPESGALVNSDGTTGRNASICHE